MEYFNFFGLPEVVQDLIVYEIVHDSIPEDRIQLARTCKYMNEAVKRAKPKKIMEIANFDMTLLQSSFSPALVTFICQYLQQFQIEELKVEKECHIMELIESEQCDFFYHLFEALKFVTKLQIRLYYYMLPAFAKLYNKLEYVEFLDFRGSIEIFNSLPHYPSRIRLNFGTNYESSVLENITKKTVNNPLSSLFFDSCIPMKDLEQFLQTTKFKNGCEIYCEVENSEGKMIDVFMTFIDDEHGFEIETFPIASALVVADQKYHGNKKKMLSLLVVECCYNNYKCAVPGISFYVTKKTQPTEPLIYDYITDDSLGTYEEQKYVLENVEENDWIRIIFDEDNAYVHYSHQIEALKFVTEIVTELDFYHDGLFPEFTEFYNKLEHVEFLDHSGSIELFNSLSHYPSKITLSALPDYDSSLLENITKKTVNNPLSSLYFDGCVPVKDLEQFLQKTKFKNGCEIYCKILNSEGKEIHNFMTYIDDEQGFEVETFLEKSSLIVADQNYDVKGKRILRLIQLSINFESSQDSESFGIPFNVTMKTQPTLPIFSDFLDGEQEHVLENVKENDWIKINTDAHVRYSNKMLESNFPRNEFASAHERVTFINATLGCQISIIKAEELIDTIQNLENRRIPLPFRENNRKRGPPSFFEDES
uniref:F-box domain-containing protein n=1 Tax=Panagrolaimus sp. JU765 TaxID=591449 RepID=A0AC34RDY4_9BILA